MCDHHYHQSLSLSLAHQRERDADGWRGAGKTFPLSGDSSSDSLSVMDLRMDRGDRESGRSFPPPPLSPSLCSSSNNPEHAIGLVSLPAKADKGVKQGDLGEASAVLQVISDHVSSPSECDPASVGSGSQREWEVPYLSATVSFLQLILSP